MVLGTQLVLSRGINGAGISKEPLNCLVRKPVQGLDSLVVFPVQAIKISVLHRHVVRFSHQQIERRHGGGNCGLSDEAGRCEKHEASNGSMRYCFHLPITWLRYKKSDLLPMCFILGARKLYND